MRLQNETKSPKGTLIPDSAQTHGEAVFRKHPPENETLSACEEESSIGKRACRTHSEIEESKRPRTNAGRLTPRQQASHHQHQARRKQFERDASELIPIRKTLKSSKIVFSENSTTR